MKKLIDDPRLIYKCCKLYYEESAGQQQIADQLGVSRVSVSRMLQAGKELGIVQIRIVSPNLMTYTKLEQELEQKFGLKEVIVVENTPLMTDYDQSTMIGNETLRLLEHYLHDDDVVGVSMGVTLHQVCKGSRTSTKPINCIFVPTLGGVSMGKKHGIDVHANQTAVNFAQLFGARYEEFFSPAMFSDKKVMEGFLKEEPLRQFLKYYQKLNTVILGIGTPNRTILTTIKAGYVTRAEVDEMVSKGMVGDLSMQFFDENGDTEKFKDFNERVVGLRFEQLKKVENRICIGAGEDKAQAIRAAIRGNLINILVTDQECAVKLLAM